MITIKNVVVVSIFLLGLLTALPLKAHAAPDIEIFPSYGADFGTFIIEGGSAPSDTRKVCIKNVGYSDLNVTVISTPSPPFSIVPPLPIVPFTLKPYPTPGYDEKCIDIQFSPTAVGSNSDKITISSDDPDESSLDVPLKGLAAGEPFTISTLGEIKIMSNADTFSFGDLITSEIKVIGDTDSFKFTGKTGGVVSITTGRQKPYTEHCDYAGCGFVPRWELYAPDGSLVMKDVDGGSGTTAPLPATGTYTILVGDGNGPALYDGYDSDTGQYGLSLHGVSASLPSCQNITNQSITEQIEAIGDTDAFCFSGKGGDTVSITTGRQKPYTEHCDYAGCGFVPRWELYAPDGSLVMKDVDGGSGTTAPLPATGTYTILVGDGDGPALYDGYDSDTGRYGLSLQCTGGCPPDDIVPIGSIIIEWGKVWTKTPSVTLYLMCMDYPGGSGCAEMQISNDGVFDTEPWEPYAATKAWTLTSGDGNKKVYVRYKDVVGNISGVYYDSIMLDTTMPVVSNVSDSPDPIHLGQISTISFTVSDNLSGTCKVIVKIYDSSNNWVRTITKTGVSCPSGGATGSVTWNLKDSGDHYVELGVYNYKVQAIDKAGNRSATKGGIITIN